MTTLRNGANPSIWNPPSTQSTHNRDVPAPARTSAAQPWLTASPTDDVHAGRTVPSDPVSVASTSGFSRTAEEPNWNPNAWTSPDPGPSTQRTTGSSSPNRARDGYLGQDRPFGHAARNSIGRLAAILDGDQETRGFTTGLNGAVDMDSSRRQESRAPGFRSLGNAPSRDASLPPSRGTNGSPSVPERFAFAGGHTPSNSLGLSHATLPASSPYTSSPTNPGLSSRSFDSTPRWAQQHDPSNQLAPMATLSLNDGPASSANGVGFSVPQPTFNGGLSAQVWQNNGPSSYLPDLTSLNAMPVAAQAGAQNPAPNRGSNPAHGSATFVPGTGQYTPPQDNRSQVPSSRDLGRPHVNGRTPPVCVNQTANIWYSPAGLAGNLAAVVGLPSSICPPNIQHNFQVPASGYQLAANSYLQGNVRLAFDASQNKDTGAEFRSPLLQEYRKAKTNGNAQKWNLHVCCRVSRIFLIVLRVLTAMVLACLGTHSRV